MHPLHRALPSAPLDPNELERTSRDLQRLSLIVEDAIHTWKPRYPDWSGRSFTACQHRLEWLHREAASISDAAAAAASLVDRLEVMARSAREEIRNLAESIAAAESIADAQERAADSAAWTASLASGADPISIAESERLRQRAAEARYRAEDARREADLVRRSAVDAADDLVETVRRQDLLVATQLDDLLNARLPREIWGALLETQMPTPSDDRGWISTRINDTAAAIQRHVETLTVAIAQIEAVPWGERTWWESMALLHLTDELALHRRFLSPGRQMLDWDPVGDGRAIEVFGDLTTARHIAVVVPGIMNTIENFDAQLAGDARDLWREAAAVDARTAVVAWLGYDTPELLNAVSKGRAVDYESDLRAFTASLPSDAHVTVVAHSYGTVLAAEAASRGLTADDLVLVGSPGTDLAHVTEADLEPGAQIFAGVSDTDWIVGRSGWGSVVCPETVIGAGWLTGLRWLASPVTGPLSWVTDSCKTDADGDVKGLSHGINPAHEDFGAIEISTEDVDGHSSYFDRGAASLEAMARIVTGTHHRQR